MYLAHPVIVFEYFGISTQAYILPRYSMVKIAIEKYSKKMKKVLYSDQRLETVDRDKAITFAMIRAIINRSNALLALS